MKVLVVTHNYPRHPDDPAGAFVGRLARGVAASGHHVTVVAPHAPGLAEEQMDGPVRVRRFRYATDDREVIAYSGDMHARARRGAGLGGILSFLWRFRAAVKRVAAEERPDVIHAHWWVPGGWMAKATGVPYVVTCHGTDVRLIEFPPLRWLARRVLNAAAVVTTVSEFLRRDLERLLGREVQSAAVLRMPVDARDFESARSVPKAEPPRILFVGNLNPSKGVDVLIRAARALKDRGINARVRIVGDGPAREDLRTLARLEGVADLVEFAGALPLNNMPREYGAATVTVLPTRGQAEGLGLSLVESLLSGTAVVGSAAGGIPEVVVPGETGLIARDGDAADLAAQLARMLTDAAFRERTAATGRERVTRDFSLDGTLPILLDIYRVAAGRAAA
ncbi:MAG: glycosyltransferase family 4 protein [Gemmatimonadetes bacterium]|nr:glycosyltransferase family 4 protein [Gemmatimonadota bacterium]